MGYLQREDFDEATKHLGVHALELAGTKNGLIWLMLNFTNSNLQCMFMKDTKTISVAYYD